MRVLIVDPDPSFRELVRISLGRDVQFVEAPNGSEALKAFERSRPDVVVAHETTENFGAFGLARDLKIDPNPPRFIVLLDREEDAWLAKWSGADRWLVLPVGPFDLAAAVREVAGQTPAAPQMPTAATEGATQEPIPG